MLQKPEISAGLIGHWARMQTFTFTFHVKYHLQQVDIFRITDRVFDIFVEETKSRRSRVSIAKSSTMGKKGTK